MSDGFAVEMRGITKTFGSVVANRDVDLDLRHGEILALLGENGSGKTTLMNMLSGIYAPDSGSIRVEGKPAVISLPPGRQAAGHRYGPPALQAGGCVLRCGQHLDGRRKRPGRCCAGTGMRRSLR